MNDASILDAVRSRLAAEGLSTRPWILLDRAGPGIAFDDSDTLRTGSEPASWQLVGETIVTELRHLGAAVAAVTREPHTGVVRVGYRPRQPIVPGARCAP